MPITASKLRVGSVIKFNNELYKVAEFEFRGTGKSAKMIQAKLHDIQKNINIDHRFDVDEKLENVELEHSKYQYLYNDQDLYYFMDPVSFGPCFFRASFRPQRFARSRRQLFTTGINNRT